MTFELGSIVRTNGELESAQQEWLHTNGAGAYSMSTLALMHTRRYHGLFVAALDPPLKRHVILSHAETTAIVKGRAYRLSTHQFPNVAPTPGYRLLETFAQDPIPRWVYRLGKSELVRRLCLVRGKNALVVSFTWGGKVPVTLSMKPLLPMRPIHELTREHGAMIQRATLRPGVVEIKPDESLPSVVFGHSGTFVGSPDWWRRFEYSLDRERGARFQEDQWAPGVFELGLEPGQTVYLTVSVGESLEGSPAAHMEATCSFLRGLDPGPDHVPSVRALAVACEQFRVDECSRPGVLAGYPWSAYATRDALISLPGLYFSQGLFPQAKRVLETILGLLQDGYLSYGIAENGVVDSRPCGDATLWLFEITRLLAEQVGTSDTFVRERLYPALRAVFDAITGEKRTTLWISEGGLIACAQGPVAQTWMDASAHGRLVTPRQGSPIELQALWSRGTRTLASLAKVYGDAALAASAEEFGQRTRQGFKARFWCEHTRYPYDVVSELRGQDDSWVDASIRPNAVMALALDPELFERWQATSTIAVARDHLLTSRGLRTLSASDRQYVGHHEGATETHRAAYHQGAVWGYLLGFFGRAALRLAPEDFELQMDLHDSGEQALQNGTLLGQVAQIATGDAPHIPGGSPAQAWSVAELVRLLRTDLGL